jgi:hypothetical protein
MDERREFLRPMDTTNNVSMKVDPSKARFPYCIVWSPLGCLTWLFPFIGHTGICDSEGVIYDFGGPYYIGRDKFTFGAATRYWQLDPSKCKAMDWDRAVKEANGVYCKKVHNICLENCHHHVACALNKMEYNGDSSHSMLGVGVNMFFLSKFTGLEGFLRTFIPFLIIAAVVSVFSSI